MKPTYIMKKITIIVLLLWASLMQAQESYPGKFAELLVGKEVKVIDNNNTHGYPDFYTDKELRKYYSPEPGEKVHTARKAILGKTFKVIDLSRSGNDMRRVTLELEGPDNLKIYYRYNDNFDFGYPFEVIGGLTLPADFYCQYIETGTSEFGTTSKASVGPGTNVNKNVDSKETSYYITFALFLPKDSKPLSSCTLILDGQKSIVKKTDLIIPEFHDGATFKYSFALILTPQDVAQIKANKIKGLRLGDQVVPLPNGEKIKGVLTCLSK
jgi:hypothetical protein